MSWKETSTFDGEIRLSVTTVMEINRLRQCRPKLLPKCEFGHTAQHSINLYSDSC